MKGFFFERNMEILSRWKVKDDVQIEFSILIAKNGVKEEFFWLRCSTFNATIYGTRNVC